jgi:predicted RNase H-like HicB family nuclease
MKYEIKLIKTEEGYAVCCPTLPGCWSEGKNKEEALENIKSAIQEYLEVMSELGFCLEKMGTKDILFLFYIS